MKLPLIITLLTAAPSFIDCCVSYSWIQVLPNKAQFIQESYFRGKSCRWHAESAKGSKISMMCYNQPFSKSLNSDCLSVYHAGELDWSDVHHYCGNGMFYIESVGNQMDVVIVTSPKSEGGAFACNYTIKGAPPKLIKDLTKEEVNKFIPANQVLSVSSPGFDPIDIRVQPATVVEPTQASQVFKPPQSTQLQKPTGSSPCQCGRSNTKNRVARHIVEGVETEVNEFPMMAGIIDGELDALICGATIISMRSALTAAHCLTRKKPNRLGLLVGDHDTSRGNDTDSAQLLVIDKFIIHPTYNFVTQDHDIAIVRVRRTIDFSTKVGPACLPFSHTKQTFEGDKVIAVGWGSTEFTSDLSKTLQKVTLNIVSTTTCQKSFPKVTYNHICSYGRYKDTCQGDSGGPLLWDDGKRLHLLGVVSYGNQCASDTPSVNTRVTQYLPWIKQSIDESEFCST